MVDVKPHTAKTTEILLTVVVSRWFDADSMIINPEIPLEIFLPPANFNDVHLLAGKDHNGLNTGIFFMRVHRWSIDFLVRVLGLPVFKPEIDLGYSADQTAMAMVLNEPQFRGHLVYQPRTWYNAYMTDDGFEGEPGALMVHFPGLDDRFSKMNRWWQVLTDETEAARWRVPLSKTAYPQKIKQFWDSLKKDTVLVNLVEDRMRAEVEAGIEEDTKLSTELEELRLALSQEFGLKMSVEIAIERMQLVLANHSSIGEGLTASSQLEMAQSGATAKGFT